jgi:antitoxin CcdA
MKPDFDLNARKRPVNLTLNGDLVDHAKTMTDNLSGVIEGLLAEYIAKERGERLARSKAIDATIAIWNEFDTKLGSIADEYSSL